MGTLKKKMPLISIIMGTKNGEKTIKNAVHSILNQDVKDFELIICNDGSTDSTELLINEMMDKDDRIVAITHSTNQGLSRSLNDCIKKSRGKFIARMDDDDISYKNRFSEQIEFLNQYKQISFVGSNIDVFENDEEIYSERKLPVYPSKNDLIAGKNYVHPTVLFRREVLVSNHYSESKFVNRIEDYELWLRLADKGLQGANLQKKLLNYREDRNSFKKRKMKYELAKILIIIKFSIKNKLIMFGLFSILIVLIKSIIPQTLRQSKAFNGR